MENIKILHTADIHIGAADSFLQGDARQRQFETLLTFERIIDLAKERNTDLVLISGDLFDSNKIESRFVDAVFEKIASASPIKVIFAAGNHDPLSSDSPFVTRQTPENLYVLPAKESVIHFGELNLSVYGKSFESVYLKGRDRFPLATDPTHINIMVQHGELKSDLSSNYNAITPNFIKNSGMDYIALGHVHKRTPIGKIEGTSFAYCGCPEGQGFDELDEKGVYVGEVGKNVCNLEFVAVSKRRHIFEKINIEGLSTGEEIAAHILNVLKEKFGADFGDNLYKLHLVGKIPENEGIYRDEIKSRIENSLYFVKIKDMTEPDFDLNALAEEISLKGIFAKKMLAKIDSADETQKPLLQEALNIGLKAFSREVKYDED